MAPRLPMTRLRQSSATMRTEWTPRNRTRPMSRMIMASIMTPTARRRYPRRYSPFRRAADMEPTSPPAKRHYWEDFTIGRVMALGSTLVTREAVLDFARQFDPQPFHLDDAAAEASLFKKLAASGWHTCAMMMRMMCDAYL